MKKQLLFIFLSIITTSAYNQPLTNKVSFQLCNRNSPNQSDISIQLTVRSQEIKSSAGLVPVLLRLSSANSGKLNHNLLLVYPESSDTIILRRLKQLVWKDHQFPLPTLLRFSCRELPYYYQKVQALVMDNQSKAISSRLNIYVYFTPYGSVEIWNEQDFAMLPRIWATPSANAPARRSIAKKDIPVSNLTLAELDNDSIEKSYLSVPGLAYTVPMRKMEDPDRIELPEDFEETAPTNRSSKARISLFKKAKNWRTWTGVVSGRLVTNVNGVNIPVTGIQVSIMQQDPFAPPCMGVDDELARVQTDNDGRFNVYISREYRIAGGLFECTREGDALELYVKIESKTPDNSIRVERRIGSVRNCTVREYNIHNWNYWESTANMGDMEVDKDIKPQLLHWAYQCRRFAFEQLGSACPLPGGGDPLVICLTPQFSDNGGAFYMPAGTRSLMLAGSLILPVVALLPLTTAYITLNFTNHDGLYIGEGAENTEETTQHEFGHYLMHRLQNRSWLNPLKASFAEHSYQANTKHIELAWTEGWADGFSFIMDAFCHRYDGESGAEDGSYDYEQRLIGNLPENNFYKIEGRSNGKVLTHGFASEFNIGALLYDLFDGSKNNMLNGGNDKEYLDNRKFINFSTEAIRNNDRVELSFLQICQPLLNKRGTGGFINQGQYLINNIINYHDELIKDKYCELKGPITRLFQYNGIGSFEEPLPLQTLNSDAIEQGGLVSYEAFKYDDKDKEWVGDGIQEYSFQWGLNANRLLGVAQSFNFASAAYQAYDELTDDLIVGKDATLYINAYRKRNFPKYYLTEFPQKGAQFFTSLCGEMRLHLQDNGKLQLGDNTSGNISKVRIDNGSVIVAEAGTEINVNNGSILEVGYQGTLYIKAGATLNLLGRSKLMVQEGAYICIETGAVVNRANDSEITINTLVVKGIKDNLGIPEGDCGNKYLPGYQRLPGCGNEALAFDGIDDYIAIPDNSSINFGTSDFTVEAFIKPMPRDGNLYIASKVLFRTEGYNSTGFGLVLDRTGGLYGWTMNSTNTSYAHFVYAENSKLIDGKCHYVAFQRQGADYRLFIDGYQYTVTNAAPADMPDNVSSSNDIFIGNSNPKDFITQPFKGWIGEFRLWNYARSAQQIADTKANLPLPQVGLVAFYDMQQEDQTLIDLSGNNNTARLGSSLLADNNDPKWLSSCDIDCGVENNFRKAVSQKEETFTGTLISPNPTNHQVKIKSDKALVEVNVKSAHGQLIKQYTFTSPTHEAIVGEDLPSGFYLFELHCVAGSTEIVKVIKSK